MDFLVSGQRGSVWVGRRVELNALTSDQFVAWLEAKLQAHGVRTVVPEEGTLQSAYARALRLERLRDVILSELDGPTPLIPAAPKGLPERVRTRIEGKPRTWDETIYEIAKRSG